MKTLNIQTPFYNYNIYLGNSLKLQEFFLDYKDNSLFLLVDENVYNLYKEHLKESFKNYKHHLIIVEAKEESKSFVVYERIINVLLDKQMKKTDLIIAIGGGVIGDLAGFVAGTIFRGVKFVNIPTTLLAMCDSSIGGKTGIDSKFGKNLIGVYKQPLFVIIDTAFLKTLKKEDYSNGMAEVIKAGFIKDKELINYLKEEKTDDLKIIEMSLKVKKEIVEIDPFEGGLRMLLNFGHTFGHAIEKSYNYEISHGYCVALGMDLAIKFGIKFEITNDNVLTELKELFKKYNLPTFSGDSNKYLKHIKYDKKQQNNYLNFIVIEDIGSAKIIKITEEDLNDLSS